MKTSTIIALISIPCLTASVTGEEMTTFTSKILGNGHVIKWSIPDQHYARLPSWNPATQEFPLSTLRMVQKAKQHLRSKDTSLPELDVEHVDTFTGQFGRPEEPLLYLFCKIQFKRRGSEEPTYDWKLSVVFLPDETIVEPKEYFNGRELTNERPIDVEKRSRTVRPEQAETEKRSDKWRIPDQHYARLPSWNPTTQEFPLSTVRMVQKAKQHLREKDSSLPELDVEYVDTFTYRFGGPDAPLLYPICKIQFKRRVSEEPTYDWKLLVVFLPDETIVEPKEYFNGRELTNERPIDVEKRSRTVRPEQTETEKRSDKEVLPDSIEHGPKK